MIILKDFFIEIIPITGALLHRGGEFLLAYFYYTFCLHLKKKQKLSFVLTFSILYYNYYPFYAILSLKKIIEKKYAM
jgi:hypothetical protein